MIRELFVAALFNQASRIATIGHEDQHTYVEACLVAEWAWKEMGYAGSCMYRPRTVTKRCTCRKQEERLPGGFTFVETRRDPKCTIHSRDTI